MIATLGRYLHQSITEVEAWDFVDFLAYYEAAAALIAQEREAT